MNKENVRKIIMLAALLAAGGCGSIPAQSGLESTGRPILSAEEAQSMIKITVTTLPSEEQNDDLIAANDY